MAEVINIKDYIKERVYDKYNVPPANRGIWKVNPDPKVIEILERGEKKEELSRKIFRFIKETDTYNFQDEVENEDDAFYEIFSSVRDNDLEPIKRYLEEIAEESDDSETVMQVSEILEEIKMLADK